ncbi:reticulocyte-binding protein homolog 2b-like isoform X2 [Hetaerina americana]|uniref:reticulocyte-binding protein homolog 2b-like isoform X2 n=1 Tax=Hetaerina americana TaxID=62018 RepID=UPI003A7F1D6F
MMRNTKDTSTMSPRDELDEVKKDLRLVKEENLKLQAVITDVTEVNKRWQKYNNDRQMYVEKLLSTIQDQQAQMNKNIENRLLRTKESEDGGDVTRQLHVENAKLRDEIGQLKRRMESMEREHKEHVEVLEIQVRANKDDWEAEKREKELARQENERLETKVQELQEELNIYKLQLREEKSSNDRVTSSQRKHCCCGSDGRESNCSSHITICRKNSFPTFRTSLHMPQGHLIPRGSTIYLGDDLVIDGDSSSSKPAVTMDSGIQGSQSNCTDDTSPLVSSMQQIPHNIIVEPSGSKDKVDIHDKSSLDIPTSSVLLPSRSTSTMSSASSLSLASAGVSKVGHSTPVDKEMTASAKNLVSSSATALSAILPPLPTSYSDTVVPNHVPKGSRDSKWNTRAFPSPLRIGANVQEAAQGIKLKSNDVIVPNLTAVDNLEEFPDGVLTQTREDVICPGCGRVFHPEIHLQFLQHFGECQNRNKANKAGTLKTRN